MARLVPIVLLPKERELKRIGMENKFSLDYQRRSVKHGDDE